MSSPDLFSAAVDGAESPLKLLLFVDQRPGMKERVQEIQAHLHSLLSPYGFDLKVISVCEHPYLVEHFKLIATPALVKISPEPRQTLAGQKLLQKVDHWWPRWQQELESQANRGRAETGAIAASLSYTTEFMRMADEIFQLTQDIESLRDHLKFKDRIISLLAHELRNPLTAVSLALETLDNYWHPESETVASKMEPATLDRLLHHARYQTTVIEHMITDLLLAARGSSSTLHIHPRKLDLNHLCRDVLADLRDSFIQKKQKITTDLPSDIPPVHADRDRVRQVLVNILDNAHKYTPEGGQIHLSALHRTTQKVQVSISDTGPGIPREQQEKVFEEQYRLHANPEVDGYGIGLSLCREIIRAHYGQIWVDSTGQGSNFQFTLPVYRG
ncbi:histidine kinase [Thermosynechococcaceae cyanobacterium BACA0444]|uniref:Adaptive-response sensory-kinase SasA n=1 Tax=Pseudocalidococcus azoricus BACA0444 TaxID=2918990 RepID=A0AAE4FQX5_9CYAN|nr:histidine kinase [Pseudocalidococcus azoricus]MDS3860644.1 histidine kinase [Pseudocalidococcus azoricus BACA0444]